MAERRGQDLGVAAGAKPQAIGLQGVADFDVVVEFAIEGDEQPPVGGQLRLNRA